MKSNKDISDLIRDNQHKLEERPNPRAWKKLEERLDQQEKKEKKPKRILLYRRLAMAAAVVAMVAVISLLNMQSNSSDMAKAEANISTQDQFAQNLEPVYSKENNNVRQVIEFRRKLKDRYTNPIQEGTQTKKLLASNNTNTRRFENKISTEALATNENLSKPVETKVKEDAAIISMEMSDDNLVESEMIEEVSAAPKDAIAGNVVSEALSEAPPVAAPAPPMSAKMEKKKQSTFSKTRAAKSGIQKLEWMSGDWISESKTLNILFLNNSDLISLDFKIKEIGNELFYIDLNNSTFELINQSENKYIFEGKNKDQIIIELIDENQFSKTLVKFNSGEKVVEKFMRK